MSDRTPLPYLRLDGYTFDHVAEYLLLEKEALLLLWKVDADGYITSVSTMLHALLLAESLRHTPPGASRCPELHDNLVRHLASRGEEEPTYVENDARAQSPAAAKLATSWQRISTIVNETPRLKNALVGLICRESFYQAMGHSRRASYYNGLSAMPLVPSDLSHITRKAKTFVANLEQSSIARRGFSRAFASALIDDIPLNLTVHYLNLFDIACSTGENRKCYAPGLTRIPIVNDGVVTDAKRSATTYSLNLQMIEKAKSREDIIKVAVAWIADNAAKVQSYRALINLPETEAAELLQELDERDGISRDARRWLKVLNFFANFPLFWKLADKGEEMIKEFQRPAFVTFVESNQGTQEKLRDRLYQLIL